jgi:ribosome-associated heat shock protein Hsp15
MNPGSPEPVRADKWLWAARFFKTRSLAAGACQGGKVSVNDQAAKAARGLRTGDLLEVTLPSGKRRVRVVALSARRGSGAAARALYEDLTPPAPPQTRVASPASRPAGAGRPTKRDRRRIDRLRVGDGGSDGYSLSTRS